MSPKKQDIFIQRLKDRRDLEPDDPEIIGLINLYGFECMVASIAHSESFPQETLGEVMQWLREVRKAAESLLHLLGTHTLLGEMNNESRDMLYTTFAAGVVGSPVHEAHKALQPADTDWEQLVTEAPSPFRWGLAIGYPFLQILRDLAAHPIFADHSWQCFQYQNPQLDPPPTIEAFTQDHPFTIEKTKRKMKPEEAQQKAAMLFCARMINFLSNHGPRSGLYDDLIDLTRFHQIPVKDIYPENKELDSEALYSRIKMRVSRGRKILKDRDKHRNALGFELFLAGEPVLFNENSTLDKNVEKC